MNEIVEKKLLTIKSKKLDILKTFEIFNKENIGVLKDKIIEIILVEADNIFSNNKHLFTLDIKKNNAVQISVLNDRKTYDLLSSTWKRHKMKQEKLNDKNKKSRLFGPDNIEK